MQFNHPGFSKCAPNFNPQFQFNGYPEMIGEGYVTSIVSPDGSIQHIFLPTSHWWRPQPYNSSPNGWNDFGAWYVRSVYNQIPPTMYNPPYQPPYGLPFPVPIASNSCLELPANNFQLKFHNDCCTSTSDIHYFYPNLRPFAWCQKPKSSVSIQVDVPKTSNSCQHEVAHTNRTCMCNSEKHKKQKDECMCYSTNSDSSVSKMSISRSEIDCQKRKDKSHNKKTKTKKSKHKKKLSDNFICECREAQSDKCVTTYMEQAIDCKEEGKETQTMCDCGILRKINTEPRKDVKTEMWIPMKPRLKNLIKITSAQNTLEVTESATSNSGCTSVKCSCCNSDSTGFTE